MVTALKTFAYALDFRISYSSIIEDIIRSDINKTLLKFFLNWNYLYINFFIKHNRLNITKAHFITFFVLIEEKFMERSN